MAQRTFRDDAGKLWTVWTVHPEVKRLPSGRPVLSPELHNGWIAFESGEERRRLTPVPEDFETLPEADLAILLAKAIPRTRVTQFPSIATGGD